MKLNRKWICLIGYLAAFGVFSNVILYQFFDVKKISWTSLISLTSIMLKISGVRDISLNKGDENDDLN